MRELFVFINELRLLFQPWLQLSCPRCQLSFILLYSHTVHFQVRVQSYLLLNSFQNSVLETFILLLQLSDFLRQTLSFLLRSLIFLLVFFFAFLCVFAVKLNICDLLLQLLILFKQVWIVPQNLYLKVYQVQTILDLQLRYLLPSFRFSSVLLQFMTFFPFTMQRLF